MNTEIKREFRLVAVDTTEYWDLSEMQEVKTIWQFYLVDTSVATYCCEITPSYWLEPLGVNSVHYVGEFEEKLKDYFSEYEERRQFIEDVIEEETAREVGFYVHYHYLNSSDKVQVSDPLGDDLLSCPEEEQDEEEVIQAIIEYFRSTPPWVTFEGKIQIY